MLLTSSKMCDCFTAIVKFLVCCMSSEKFQDLFLDMAASLAAETENTIDDLLVEELRRRLKRSR
jgi:hypothetical protein